MRVVLVVILCGIPLMAGIVWSRPWPPKRSAADRHEERPGDPGEPASAPGSLRRTTLIALLAYVLVLTIIPVVFDGVWLRYALLVLLPLVVGFVIRRLLRR